MLQLQVALGGRANRKQVIGPRKLQLYRGSKGLQVLRGFKSLASSLSVLLFIIILLLLFIYLGWNINGIIWDFCWQNLLIDFGIFCIVYLCTLANIFFIVSIYCSVCIPYSSGKCLVLVQCYVC